MTGVAGFVGSTLAEQLLTQGEQVLGIDSLNDYYDRSRKLQNLSGLQERPGFTLVQGDLNDLDLPPLIRGARAVFHQAGQPGVRSSWGREFRGYTSNNVDATQALLEAARACTNLERFVYASSSSVYGDAERYPTSESDLPQPRSPYGVTKLAAEHLCVLYGRAFGLPTTSLRYFTVYGPRQRPDMAFTRFIEAALTGQKITLYGDGNQIRDFTFVEDIAAANISAWKTSTPDGTVVNVSGGSSVTVNWTLEIIQELCRTKLDIERLPTVLGDVRQTGGDATKVKDLLGWTPQTSLEEGLARHVAWARGRLGSSRT